ncbi:MAG: tRNA (adenosine(37)-N6)-threonylcarbamoyltransferase complex transferase subunit TsaD [Rhodospirillaceae bacterium]|nr:tRNA (adenosine(37)-N6)-threonylcarbamoyltransferase complex transferase subunit TsaD [Rhodospirillaceae bacterium]HAA91545.1 tRNA (adenosine(37)-N6)-threonylcarbamoyltransferase complex transferase subunit TsaD [Rhodospirillaceae bacterium]
MRVLGIETSCDETAAAIVDGNRRILSDQVLSQVDEHKLFGGVVPEIAARSHLDHIDRLVTDALSDAELNFSDLDAIAATTGPGLIGGVMVGMMTAKGLALATGLPFVAVNHMEGHALVARLIDDLDFPYLALLVSGGHSQFIAVSGVGRYDILGTTVDDALGEAFDKTAKLLGLGFPGGPALEVAAKTGDPERFSLPRPMLGRPNCDFSFSGLKTAVRQTVEKLNGTLDGTTVNDLAASFQNAVADCLSDRCIQAIKRFRNDFPEGNALVVGGGVASNEFIRKRLEDCTGSLGFRLVAPPIRLCTDNGAMVAWAGVERLRLGLTDGLEIPARPRWPLDARRPDAHS